MHIDANVIQFQCPSCGFELRQTIGLLKAEKRMVCAGCNVGINIDTERLAAATEALRAGRKATPGENSDAHFKFGGFNGYGEAPTEAGNQAVLHAGDFLGIGIAGNHHLLM